MSAARVVKLGGSLLDWPEWPAQLRSWLAVQPIMQNILIAGGGALADVVRQWDRDYHLDAKTAHWLAIDAMSVTARLAARLLNVDLTAGWESLIERLQDTSQSERGGSLVVFDPREFLHGIEAALPGSPLPHDWQATSDSIAARVAEAVASRTGKPVELVLLKSALPGGNVVTLHQAAAAVYVDAVLPNFAGRIGRIRCVNLRGAGWHEWTV